MDGSDGGLQVIRRLVRPLGALAEVPEAERDQPRVPERAILIFQQNDLVAARPGGPAAAAPWNAISATSACAAGAVVAG